MNKAQMASALTDINRKLTDLIKQLDDDAPVLEGVPAIPFKDNPSFEIPEKFLVEWYQRYGEAWTNRQLWSLRYWCLDNPEKQKYSKSARKFLGNNLLRSAGNEGRIVGGVSTAGKYSRKQGQKK